MSDTKIRCKWCVGDALYEKYHDQEWGTPVYDDATLFEFLILETFQAGLSWITILRKRENFRKAFDDFEPKKIAKYDAKKIEALMNDAGIVRNRAKIDATIGNARAIRDHVPEGLDTLLWSYAPDGYRGRPRSTSPESIAMSKQLRKRGFRFVGPTTSHSLMQAVGMVNEHEPGCWRAV